MMSRFSSYVLALLLLVASGQVMATDYFSIVANPTLTATALAGGATPVAGQWAASCTGATITIAFSSTAEDDTFTLCGTTAGTNAAVATMAAGAFGEHAASLTIQAGAKLTLSDDVTSGTDFDLANEGTLVIPAANTFTLGTSSGAYTSTAGVLESTCESVTGGGAWTTAATWGTTTRCGLVTAATSTVPASPNSLTDVIIASTAAVTAGTGTVKSLTFKTGVAGLLTLSGALSVTGAISFTSATAAVLTGTGQTITLGGALTTVAAGNIAGGPALTLTDVGHVLNIGATLAAPLGVLTLATLAATQSIQVTGNALGVASTSGFGNCTATIAATATSIPVATYSCTAPPAGGTVSAPIFSTKEKAAVFGQEVK